MSASHESESESDSEISDIEAKIDTRLEQNSTKLEIHTGSAQLTDGGYKVSRQASLLQSELSTPSHNEQEFWNFYYSWEDTNIATKVFNKIHDIRQHENTKKLKEFCNDHRFIFGLLIPFLTETCIYWILATSFNLTRHFNEVVNGTPRYWMAIAMIVGSFIAGSTPVGGGVVGFPMITLIFNRPGIVGNHFGLLVQAVGMSGASFAILFMNLAVEWNAIIYGTLGGFIGYPMGIQLVKGMKAVGVPSVFNKFFLSILWTDFVVALYMLNRVSGRRSFHLIPSFGAGEYVVKKNHLTVNWKALILFIFGILGGIVTAIGGTGIDICMFACLTLIFRVVENVASRTSVILMTIQSWYAIFYLLITAKINTESLAFISVCAPVTVFMAPLGAVFASKAPPQLISQQLYVVETITFVSTLVILEPWSMERYPGFAHALTTFGLLAIFFGTWLFNQLKDFGLHLMEIAVSKEMKSSETDEAEIDSNRHEWSSYNTALFKHSLEELRSMKHLIQCDSARQHVRLFANSIHLQSAVDYVTEYTDLKQSTLKTCMSLGHQFIALQSECPVVGLHEPKYDETQREIIRQKWHVELYEESVQEIIVKLEQMKFMRKFIKSKFGKDYIWRQTIAMEQDDEGSVASASQLSKNDSFLSVDKTHVL